MGRLRLEEGQPVRIRILDEALEYIMRLLSPLGIYASVVGKLSRITWILWGQDGTREVIQG